MKPLTVLRLDLRSPIVYRSAPSLRPFVRADRIEERLFCFGLAEEQYQSMEGEDAAYLGDLLFAGAQSLDTESPSAGITLPQGTYMFAQVEELLDRPTFIA
ncbi:MAG: hypothetical protein LBD74_00025, partial [Spirochaetaceae bacterium]|nr:hypothetical protein [Spirochaetaceae bacterium]